MALNTWKSIFLPEEEDKWDTDYRSAEKAVKKYQGALPKNLLAHELAKIPNYPTIVGYRDPNDEEEIVKFEFVDKNCGFCRKYYEVNGCLRCPVAKADIHCNSHISAWNEFRETDKPQKMIKVLKTVMKRSKKTGYYHHEN